MCKMKRSVILKTDAKQTLIWLHDWFYRESPVTGDFISGEFNVKAKDLADYMFDEIPRKNLPTNMTDQDLRNRLESFFQENLNTTVKGRLSDLFTDKKETTLIIYAQYRAEISGKAVANSYIRIPVLTIKCYGVGQLQTQVIAIDCSPDVIHILDALWQDIHSTFEIRDRPAIAVTKVSETQTNSGKVEKTKNSGRYRLSKDEIKFRRQQVKEANEEKKQNPLKHWNEIDFEFSEKLKISKESFRRWRHNNY